MLKSVDVHGQNVLESAKNGQQRANVYCFCYLFLSKVHLSFGRRQILAMRLILALLENIRILVSEFL